MRLKQLKIYVLSACVTISVFGQTIYGQERSFAGTWKLNNKQQIIGTVYSNAIPTLITVSQLNDKLIIESKGEDQNGKEQIIVDTVNLDGSLHNSITASNRRKETRIENFEKDKSFTRIYAFSTSGEGSKMDFTRKESWSLDRNGKNLAVVREQSSAIDSTDKWKVKGWYEKVTLEELTLNKVTGKGIKFEEGLTWENLVKKASAENKMIFVDCYATWCGPCRQMDVNTYPVDRVGELMNNSFINVKLQMDSTKGDNESIKLLYTLAKKFAKEYNVIGLPTLLFFSSNGKILHKGIGGMTVNEFLLKVNEALDPSKQLYTQLDRLRNGKADYTELASLTAKVRNLKEKIPDSYIQSYFQSLNQADLLKKENIQFAIDFLSSVRSSNKIFTLCYKKPADINKIMGREVAKGFVVNVIYQEEIAPQIEKAAKSNTVPDWSKMKNAICKKYNCKYADISTSLAQTGWYRPKKDWKNYTKALVKYMDVHGYKGEGWAYSLNDHAWEIFIYSDNRKEMTSAVKWVDKAIQLMKNELDQNLSTNPENDRKLLAGAMDTKAALLYKMGKLKEAISIYESIVKVDPDFNGSLEKLKAGENPWVGAIY